MTGDATPAVPFDETRAEGHSRDDRCIRDCCSGLREGYAEAWTEAEGPRD